METLLTDPERDAETHPLSSVYVDVSLLPCPPQSPVLHAQDALLREVLTGGVLPLLRTEEGGAYGQVLDVACGDGRLLDLVPLLPGSYVGIDTLRPALHRASARYPRHIFLDQSPEYVLARQPQRWYTTLTCLGGNASSVLDPTYFPRLASRVLQPGGGFCLVYLSPRSGGPSVPSAHVLRYAFTAQPDLACVRVRGVNSALQSLWPRAPRRVAEEWLHAELATVGSWWPDLGHLLIVTGRHR